MLNYIIDIEKLWGINGCYFWVVLGYIENIWFIVFIFLSFDYVAGFKVV